MQSSTCVLLLGLVASSSLFGGLASPVLNNGRVLATGTSDGYQYQPPSSYHYPSPSPTPTPAPVHQHQYPAEQQNLPAQSPSLGYSYPSPPAYHHASFSLGGNSLYQHQASREIAPIAVNVLQAEQVRGQQPIPQNAQTFFVPQDNRGSIGDAATQPQQSYFVPRPRIEQNNVSGYRYERPLEDRQREVMDGFREEKPTSASSRPVSLQSLDSNRYYNYHSSAYNTSPPPASTSSETFAPLESSTAPTTEPHRGYHYEQPASTQNSATQSFQAKTQNFAQNSFSLQRPISVTDQRQNAQRFGQNNNSPRQEATTASTQSTSSVTTTPVTPSTPSSAFGSQPRQESQTSNFQYRPAVSYGHPHTFDAGHFDRPTFAPSFNAHRPANSNVYNEAITSQTQTPTPAPPSPTTTTQTPSNQQGPVQYGHFQQRPQPIETPIDEKAKSSLFSFLNIPSLGRVEYQQMPSISYELHPQSIIQSPNPSQLQYPQAIPDNHRPTYSQAQPLANYYHMPFQGPSYLPVKASQQQQQQPLDQSNYVRQPHAIYGSPDGVNREAAGSPSPTYLSPLAYNTLRNAFA